MLVSSGSLVLAPSLRGCEAPDRKRKNVTGNVEGVQAETFACQFSSRTWAPLMLRGGRAGFPDRGASSLWLVEGLLLEVSDLPFSCSVAKCFNEVFFGVRR